MAKYHITDDGPKPCTASIKQCKYGEHFTNAKEAQQHFENKIAEANNLTETLSKSEKFNFNTPIESDNHIVNGKTLSEYNHYLNKLHRTNARDISTTQKEIKDTLNISNIDDTHHYNVEAKPNGDANTITLSAYVSNPYYDGDTDVVREIKIDESLGSYIKDIKNNNNYINSTAETIGYYGEELLLMHTFKTPEDAKILVQEYNDYYATISNYQRLTDESLPDWASLPVNSNASEEPNIKPPTPVTSVQDYNKFKRLSDPQKVIKEQEELVVNNTNRINNIKEDIKALEDLKDDPNVKSMEFNTRFNKRQGEEARKMALELQHNKLANVQAQLRNNKKNIEQLKKVDARVVENAKVQVAGIENKYNREALQYQVAHLERFHPSNNANERKRAATEWVTSHPEILNKTW